MHKLTLVADSTATSVKNATVLYYIHIAFLFNTCHCCLYVVALKLNPAILQQ